jgi:hypothetical protein
MVNVAMMSTQDKVAEAVRRSQPHLPAAAYQQLEALISPTNIAIFSGTLVVWAGSHFFGVGEIVDVGLLLLGAFFVGWSIEGVARDLYTFGTLAVNARSEAELDQAGRALASAVVNGGLTVVMALLLRRSAQRLQATRGSNVRDVARPRSPGMEQVEADTQASAPWRRPTLTPDPNLPAGSGRTWWFGDAEYSTAGTASDAQLARIHELVHQFLRPRMRFLRRFRARLNASAYWRSATLRYLEEALAESVAQVSVNGITSLLTGLRFPIANGYMTLQQLACEGAEIGTILVGTTRFSVQVVLAAPAMSCDESQWAECR